MKFFAMSVVEYYISIPVSGIEPHKLLLYNDLKFLADKSEISLN